MRLIAVTVALLLAGLFIQACRIVCKEPSCTDQFTAMVTAADNALPAGTHTLSVTADGRTLSCTFAIPPDPPGRMVAADCQPGLTLTVGERLRCLAAPDAAAGDPCVEAPGRIEERLTLPGTPALVLVQQTVAGSVVLDRSVSPDYNPPSVNSESDSENCQPGCRLAGVAWTIP